MKNKTVQIGVLALFCVVLALCLILDVSIVIALLVGLCIFVCYGLSRGFSLKELAKLCLEGIKTAKTVFLTLLIIGVLTAVWRASGCIPSFVCYASRLISPKWLVLLTFLLTSLMSTLTGTAFGTAATMGVICVSIARAINMPLFWVGGAVLSGVFVGDRCSPVSSCALLVSSITKTDIYDNIRIMLKTAAFPFVLSCVIYCVAGLFLPVESNTPDIFGLFSQEFSICLICLLPAAAVVILALFRVKVRPLLAVSILIAFFVAVFVQGQTVPALLKAMLLGYEAKNETLSAMINGGGVKSMLKVSVIVCIASCYSGIFRETGLLDFMEEVIQKMAERWGAFPATLLTAVPVSAIACNQTLSVMLTNQLTGCIGLDKDKQMINLADTAVVIAPLIPWCIAGSVPLASAGAPLRCILSACFLYILPICRLIGKSDGTGPAHKEKENGSIPQTE